ncbi:N-6 DNA methylase [Candidatus Acetothermia bacterium]|nr:N-6 DNA methylase [Candidatus Acetothermia bacterium]
MATLNLKPTHKALKEYFSEISKLSTLDISTEGSVSPAFAALLRSCAQQSNLTLVEQYRIRRGDQTIVADGALLDSFKLVHGVWEAKGTRDDLEKEVQAKFKKGYPKDNILFQAPNHVILWQNGNEIINEDVADPKTLIDILKAFFEYQPPAYEQWHQAVEEFKNKVPELAQALLDLIDKERQTNKKFVAAFNDFAELCRAAINPNIALQAVEEMLIQHLLTERIFSKIFDNPDFANRNVIAREIEKVIVALTSKSFSRHEFLKSLDRFYGAIESTASTINDYSEKQAFLNTVYEKFFQGFSVKVADTHGIVYTPQSIVDFMVRSVEEILKQEFGKSLSDKGVHIIDPFVGTGNFITRIMREMKRTSLAHKYANELHCNEVMLLPYYIASMNIEHEYLELTKEYKPFDGICLVDTFELAESKERSFSFLAQENTERVKRQKEAPIFVVIANPPYNAKQVNENDNNKNRKYEVIDQRVRETYSKDSQATNKNALSDVYVKAYRWATDRIGSEGIVAYISNNSFVENYAFDGMRKQLGEDFDSIYILDLGGNVRENPKLSGTMACPLF